MKIPIVNEQDQIIKNIDIKERQSGDICRVSALWITNEKNKVLLAQRAYSKKRSPRKWGPAVAGTVEEGETYEENIIKESEEEIGLTNIKPKIEEKRRRSTSHEHFTQWFSVVIDSKYLLVKQDLEVEEIRWFTKEDILKIFNENPNLFLANFDANIKYFFNIN